MNGKRRWTTEKSGLRHIRIPSHNPIGAKITKVAGFQQSLFTTPQHRRNLVLKWCTTRMHPLRAAAAREVSCKTCRILVGRFVYKATLGQ